MSLRPKTRHLPHLSGGSETLLSDDGVLLLSLAKAVKKGHVLSNSPDMGACYFPMYEYVYINVQYFPLHTGPMRLDAISHAWRVM